MSQSPREPQSKWGPSEAAQGGIPPNEQVPAIGVPAVDVPAVDVAPTEAPVAEVPVVGSTKPDQTKALAAPAPAPVAPAVAAVPPLQAAAPLVEQPPPAVAPYAAPASVASVPTVPVSGLATPVEAVSLAGDSAFDDRPASPLTLKDRLRRISPVYVTLAVVSIGSVIFLSLAMTSHTTPIAVLLSAGVVTFLAFGLDAAICSVASYGAGQRDEAGRALLFALLGGVSAVICALSMAGTLIMILVLAG